MSGTFDLAAAPAAVRQLRPAAGLVLGEGAGRLRFTTAGSVDDGKSTLIGRLLYDTKSVFEDQLLGLEAAGRRRGEPGLNLALLTDGLRAEREQNITIDVAHRYFATPRRAFAVADSPGHAQYTRNMVTGASNADLALILVDARKGIQTQSRRHAFVSALLGISHFLVAVNKMDLVGYGEAAYREIVEAGAGLVSKLGVPDVVFLPISALHGDNVVERSRHMPWYEGPTLLHHLETVSVAGDENLLDFRFPVQCVIGSRGGYRGFAGRVVSGTIRPGEEVLLLPSRQTSRIRGVETADGPQREASAGDAVVLTIADELDVSRGDMIVRRHNLPAVGSRLDAMLCWMSPARLEAGAAAVLMQTTRALPASVGRIEYRIDPETLHRQVATGLELNDIGRVTISTAQPLFFDPFRRNRATGGFILVDPVSHATLAAGMIRGEARDPKPGVAARRGAVSPAAIGVGDGIARSEQERRNGHQAAVVWFTGLSGSGKSTLARQLERRLFTEGCQTVVLDGDRLRQGLCGDLGFSPADRSENIRRAGELAKLFFDHGSLVLCAFVSPFRRDRDRVRALVGPERFIEVFVDCGLEECRRRDPKGLYAEAGAGALTDLTGVGQPYEPPLAPELVAASGERPPAELAAELLALLRVRGIVPGAAG